MLSQWTWNVFSLGLPVCSSWLLADLNVSVEVLQVSVVLKDVLQTGSLPTHLLLHTVVDQRPSNYIGRHTHYLYIV